MNSKFPFLAILLTLTIGTIGQGTETANFGAGQVVLKVQLSVTLEAKEGKVVSNNASLQAVLDQIQAVGIKELFPSDRAGTPLSRMYVVYIDPTSDVLEAVQKLMDLECVDRAQPNYIGHFFTIPNDQSFEDQWSLKIIQCPGAWDLFTGNERVVVAVVDSGVDWAHQDLADNIWINEDEIPDNGIDDDHNGYVDDVRGWDFVNDFVWEYEPYGTEDNNPGNDPSDPINPHGTHVAGIIGAVGNNTVSSGTTNICGVLWNCRIMVVRAGDTGLLNTDIVQAIRYVADNGAQVINMSFGGYYPDGTLDSALNYAHSKGVALCAAAGNENTYQKSYPAASANVISVAATDATDKRASFSNYGDWVDLSAPGENILSTLLNNSYGEMSGTSMACPMVSGAAGMVIGYGNFLGKKFTPGQVEYILKQSADNIDGNNPGYEGKLGAGRINLSTAFAVAQNLPAMITLVEIQSADNPAAQTITVQELKNVKLKAMARYADGTSGDITDRVSWSVRPVKYGQFSTTTYGQFNAFQVPGDREISIIASIDDQETTFGEKVITILNDPSASPLVIHGPDQVDPLSINGYSAKFQTANGETIDVTEQATWETILGAEFGTPDPAQKGVLMTTGTSGGQVIVLQATYVDDTDRRVYQQTKQIQVRNQARQVAGLFLTAPSQLAAGSSTQLYARLLFADQIQYEDVTGSATWTVTPSAAGSFPQPGLFLAGNVTSETAATLTCQYVFNGQVYTAQLTTKVIPAVAQGITVTNNTGDDTENGEKAPSTLSDLLKGLPCGLPAILLIGFLAMSGLRLTRPE